MELEITDPNCIVKAFQNNNISIIKDEDNKYYFRGSDVAKALEITNIRSSIQNFTYKEKGVRKVDTLGGPQDIIFLSSHGIYRLLYSSKKKIAENFREWVGDILDDIIFNQSKELQKQLENQKLLFEQEKETTTKLIEEKDKNIKKLTNEKMLEKHNILLREFRNIGSIVYIIKVKTFESGEYIIKIGESRIGLEARYNDHKSNYEQAIILDCFLVKNSKNFESFLHTKFKYNKVTDLEGHKNENELFLIGKELSYSHIIEVINQNIKYYNDDYTEIEKLRLENSNLKIVKELNKDLDIKNIMCVMLNNNKMIINKIDNLEKTIIELKNELSSINTRKVNNFNEPLVTLGPRLQKINPETLKLIKVYDSVSECIKENINIKRPSVNKACIENTIYQGFRWQLVDRELDPNVIYDIKQTKITRIQHTGYIAKLNSDKTKILKIYLDRKTAAKLNGYRSDNCLDNVVKNCSLSNGNYYMLYHECKESLKESYIKPILYKNGVGKFDSQNNLINEFTCKEDCRIKDGISNKTLTKALDTRSLYNNHYYRYISNKLEC
jgi:prophage antirepressor-like protein